MSIHDALKDVKSIIDECEEVVRNGKLAISTRNVELALMVVEKTSNMSTRLKSVLLEIKRILNDYRQNDSLAKYVSTYYRMIVWVSLPYIAMILRNIVTILEKGGYPNKAEEAERIAESLESIIKLLKSYQ